MERAFPHGEDPDATAGGDTSSIQKPMGKRITISQPSTPPGEDGTTNGRGAVELENQAMAQAQELAEGDETPEPEIDFLKLVQEAEQQSLQYANQANRRAWSDSLHALHNEHHGSSKYNRPESRGRSKLFVPKTRAAMRKDNAAVASSLFNSIDAINCLPGNEADPKQKAAAAIMEELVNYRTDRSSGKAALPWFMVAMGARQDALATGVCMSKQYWLQEYRVKGSETVQDENGKDVQRDVLELTKDRPDILGIPPENFTIAPDADWRNPAQSAAYLIIKWPMQIDEIKEKQKSPVNPWLAVDEQTLKSSAVTSGFDMEAIRRAREMGLDRLNEVQTGTTFQIVWVYEVFMRVGGDDYTFYAVGSKHYLTEPQPVREAYPAHFGERPIALGYGSLESHRIYPMSPVESWQPLQQETNDLRNLRLDANKQNVMPISKVRRGRQIDLDQVRRRASGSSIIVQEPDDVTWEAPPAMAQGAVEIDRELGLEFDDLSGQQNFGSVQTNNALGKTLGGLKLAAGAANAVQEYDIRVWIETWVNHALSQLVQLEQYYESDAVVLGICGERAQLFEKYGINQINDDLLEQEVTVRVNAGLGAGDPQQRLAKFQAAASIAVPLLSQSPDFTSGKVTMDWEAVATEIFGAAGYRDGGKRFFKVNEQAPENPMADLQKQEIMANIEKSKAQGKSALFTGLAAVAKVALGKREAESNMVDMLLGHQKDAHEMGADHGHRHNDQHLSARDHGHRHGMDIAEHRRQLLEDSRNHEARQAEIQANGADEGAEMGGKGAKRTPAASGTAPPEQSSAPSSPSFLDLLKDGQIEFLRGPDGRISGMKAGQQATA